MSSVKLIEVVVRRSITNEGKTQQNQEYTLQEIYISPEHVVCMRTDELMQKKLDAELLPENLDSRQEFTKIYINRGQTGLDVTVVGNPDSIQRKFIESEKKVKKELLKG